MTLPIPEHSKGQQKPSLHFVPMTADHAACILTWKYPPPYNVYDYDQEADHLMDEDLWGKGLFTVLDSNNGLVGELSLGFLDSTDEWVSTADMMAGNLEGCILWIGFGMRPDLTGKGLGLNFVNACIDYATHLARQVYQYPGRFIGLGVYQFNQRAIKVYEKAGFIKFLETTASVNGLELPAQRMKKEI